MNRLHHDWSFNDNDKNSSSFEVDVDASVQLSVENFLNTFNNNGDAEEEPRSSSFVPQESNISSPYPNSSSKMSSSNSTIIPQQPQPLSYQNEMPSIGVTSHRRCSSKDFLQSLNGDQFLSHMLLAEEERLQSRCNVALNGSMPSCVPQPSAVQTGSNSTAPAPAASTSFDNEMSGNTYCLPTVISHERMIGQSATQRPSALALGEVSSNFNSNNVEWPEAPMAQMPVASDPMHQAQDYKCLIQQPSQSQPQLLEQFLALQQMMSSQMQMCQPVASSNAVQCTEQPPFNLKRPCSPNKSISKTGATKKRPAPKKKRPDVRKLCSHPLCANRVVQGGKCISHGAVRKKCSFPGGCTKNVKSAGRCSAHGPARKQCTFLDEVTGIACCTKVAVLGGLCVGHGAKKPRCGVEWCVKQGIVGGMCKRHHDEVNGVAKVEKSPVGRKKAKVVR